MTQYRIIDWREMRVLPQDIPTVEQVLAKAGWKPMASTVDGEMLELHPQPEPYEATDNIQVLFDLAEYIKASQSQIILSVDDKDWLHILYDGQGGYQAIKTPAHQFKLR